MSLPYKKVPAGVLAYQTPTGQIPLSQLTMVMHPVHTSWRIGEFQLQAARAMRAMAVEAWKAGIIIASTGDYRSYTEQVTLFRSRYVDTGSVSNPPGGTDDRFWPKPIYGGTNTYWRRVRGAAAAVPGKSNHGLGIANDMAQRTHQGAIVALTNRVTGARSSLWDWLNANGRRFGWSWGEAISENWHWVYIEGDDIPQAVLAYETPLPPPNWPPYNPANNQWGLYPVAKKVALSFGTGYTAGTQQYQGLVTYFSDVLRFKAGHELHGPVFLQPHQYAVRDLNAFFNSSGSNRALAVEAWGNPPGNTFCGGETWKIVDFLASRK